MKDHPEIGRRNAQNITYFIGAKIFHLSQDKGPGCSLGHFPDAIIKHLAEFSILKGLLRVSWPTSGTNSPEAILLELMLQNRAQLVNFSPTTSAQATIVIRDFPLEDGQHPSPLGRIRLELTGRSQGSQEGLLNELLSYVPIMHAYDGEAEQGIAVLFDPPCRFGCLVWRSGRHSVGHSFFVQFLSRHCSSTGLKFPILTTSAIVLPIDRTSNGVSIGLSNEGIREGNLA